MLILKQQRAKDCQGPRIALAWENLLAVVGGLAGFVTNYSCALGHLGAMVRDQRSANKETQLKIVRYR